MSAAFSEVGVGTAHADTEVVTSGPTAISAIRRLQLEVAVDRSGDISPKQPKPRKGDMRVLLIASAVLALSAMLFLALRPSSSETPTEVDGPASATSDSPAVPTIASSTSAAPATQDASPISRSVQSVQSAMPTSSAPASKAGSPPSNAPIERPAQRATKTRPPRTKRGISKRGRGRKTSKRTAPKTVRSAAPKPATPRTSAPKSSGLDVDVL
jgi:hypothetical protein